MNNIEYHPAANIFPMMDSSEFQKLANDIKENGLIEPIILHEERVLDGRNRLEACNLVGIEPRFGIFDGKTSPTLFVVSKNVRRRHLTSAQQSAIGAEMLPLLEQEAQDRMLSTLRNQQHSSLVAAATSEGRATEVAGRAVGVSRHSVERAAVVKEADPELFAKIKNGQIAVKTAYKQVKSKNPVKREPRKSVKQNIATAQAHKRRMENGLSMIGGACNSLSKLNLPAIASILSPEEVSIWVKKANDARKDLASFIKSIQKEASCVNQ